MVLLLVLAGASAVSAYFEGPVAKPAEDFSVAVHVDQDAYEAHDQVHITTEVCSRRWWWRVTSQVPVAWQVVDEHGEVVADTSHRWQTLAYIPEPWAPRQCRTFEDEWDQHNWNREERRSVAGPVRGERVPAREYRIRASWAAISLHDTPPISTHPAVDSAPFKIER